MTLAVREAILEMFKFVKTILIEMFDERYVAAIEVAAATTTTVVPAAGLQGGGSIKYREFNNMKPLKFDGVKDPIMVIRRILMDLLGSNGVHNAKKSLNN